MEPPHTFPPTSWRPEEEEGLGRKRQELQAEFLDDVWQRAIADRIVVMDDGRVVEEGTAEAIFNRPQHPATRALVEEANDGP